MSNKLTEGQRNGTESFDPQHDQAREQAMEILAFYKKYNDENINLARAYLDLVKRLNARDILFNALEKISTHNTLGGEKYNNYTQAYVGVVEFATEALDTYCYAIKEVKL